MSKINIHRQTFLEKEELTRMITFLDDKPVISALFASSLSFGLVSPGGKPANPFKVTASMTVGSINMIGGYVVGSDYKSYFVDNQIDIPVPNDSKYYWLKVSPFSRNYENGYVQVDVSGNVSGSVNFEGIVRGQSSGVPTCLKFIKNDGSEPVNNQVYQVVDILNNNNIILSGGHQFKVENQLRVIILGSIPMGRRFTDEQLEGLYTFDTYNLTLIPEPTEGVEPDKQENEYWIARVRNNAGSVTVLDERVDFWNLGGSSSGELYTFAINSVPSDAKVIIDGMITSSISVIDGREGTWSVSRSGYITQTGTYKINGSDYTISVVLAEDPNPVTQANITVITENGGVDKGTVSINSATINKSKDDVIVDIGITIRIYAQASEGYKFLHWKKGSVIYNSIPIQDIVADTNTIYTAVFSQDMESDYWNFETVVTDGSGHELYTVLTQSGSVESEALMVKI